MNVVRDSHRYLLSFTSGSLFLQGASLAAVLYQETGDWTAVRAKLRADNLLQARTESTSNRWAFEVAYRLEMLNSDELSLVADATGDELSQLMWVAACRRYLFIGEFAEEVLRDRYLLLKTHLFPKHFDVFVSGKKLWHEELSDIAESTLKKLRSNIFVMLQEADLVTKQGVIVPTVIAARVLDQIGSRAPSEVRFFPTSGST